MTLVETSAVDWLPTLKPGWTLRPLWSMFERIKDIDHPEEQMLSVFRDYGVVAKDSRDNLNKTADNRSIYQLVHPGWLVTNRMKAWQGSVGISSLRGIVSGHYICFAPRHSEDPDYLNWLFRSPPYAHAYALLSRGVRIGQVEIDNDDYRLLPVLLPPPGEQRAIAAYLDRETARIETLIEEQQHLIELLLERRRSVADELLRRTSAVCPLKRVTADVTVGIVVNPAAWYVERGVPALRGLNVRPGYINPTDLVYLSAEGDARHEKSRLRTGDVVVVRTGQAGAAAVVPPDLDESNAIDLLIIRPGPKVDPNFLVAYLNAPSTKTRITEGSVGAIQGHFNVAALRELSFPVLGIAEQRDYVEQWLYRSRAIDTLCAETEQFIELSRERRSALITAAVTGQIDVRAEVA